MQRRHRAAQRLVVRRGPHARERRLRGVQRRRHEKVLPYERLPAVQALRRGVGVGQQCQAVAEHLVGDALPEGGVVEGGVVGGQAVAVDGFDQQRVHHGRPARGGGDRQRRGRGGGGGAGLGGRRRLGGRGRGGRAVLALFGGGVAIVDAAIVREGGAFGMGKARLIDGFVPVVDIIVEIIIQCIVVIAVIIEFFLFVIVVLI